MNETIKAFVKKVREDKALQEKLAKAKNIDEAYAIASAAQPDLKKEDYVAAVKKVSEAMNTFAELNDEDVAKVAGGSTVDDIVQTIQSVTQSLSQTIQVTIEQVTKFMI